MSADFTTSYALIREANERAPIEKWRRCIEHFRSDATKPIAQGDAAVFIEQMLEFVEKRALIDDPNVVLRDHVEKMRTLEQTATGQLKTILGLQRQGAEELLLVAERTMQRSLRDAQHEQEFQRRRANNAETLWGADIEKWESDRESLRRLVFAIEEQTKTSAAAGSAEKHGRAGAVGQALDEAWDALGPDVRKDWERKQALKAKPSTEKSDDDVMRELGVDCQEASENWEL